MLLSHFFWRTKGESMTKKSSWVEIRIRRLVTHCHYVTEICVIYLPIGNRLKQWELKGIYKLFPHTHSLLPLSTKQGKGMESGGCSQSTVLHLCNSFMVTLPLLHVESLLWDTILPELILHVLPTSCSSPGTAPLWLCITGPTLQALPHTGPMGSSSPSPLVLLQAPLHGLQLWPGVLLWGLSMGCTSFRTHPLLLHGCKWRSLHVALMGAGGQPDTLWASPGLQGASALCLEYLLPSSALTLMTSVLFLSTFSHSFLSAVVAQQMFPFLNLLSERCSQHCSWLRSGQWHIPFGATAALPTTKPWPHKPNTVQHMSYAFKIPSY